MLKLSASNSTSHRSATRNRFEIRVSRISSRRNWKMLRSVPGTRAVPAVPFNPPDVLADRYTVPPAAAQATPSTQPLSSTGVNVPPSPAEYGAPFCPLKLGEIS